MKSLLPVGGIHPMMLQRSDSMNVMTPTRGGVGARRLSMMGSRGNISPLAARRGMIEGGSRGGSQKGSMMMKMMESPGARGRLLLQRSQTMSGMKEAAKEARRRRRGSAVEATGLGIGGKAGGKERREKKKDLLGSIDDSGYMYFRKSDSELNSDNILAGFFLNADGLVGDDPDASRVSMVREEMDDDFDESRARIVRDDDADIEEGGEEGHGEVEGVLDVGKEGVGHEMEQGEGNKAGWLVADSDRERDAAVKIQKRARGLFERNMVSDMKVGFHQIVIFYGFPASFGHF